MDLPRVQAAQVQLQLACDGTVLEARGSATLKRAITKLNLSLTLEAEAPSAKAALALLQQRLDAVRTSLQGLAVQELRVTSPSVWNRYVPAGKPAVFEASSQVSGQLAPAQLQSLISQVGGLPGVRLAPVHAEADKTADGVSNRQLVQAAYRDALQRAQALAEAIGLRTLRPLQVQLDGGVRPAPMMAAMALERRAPAPFDPRELPEPSDMLALEATSCAIP
ncbi:MAG: SIMPL domain-containing protein [Cyanobacteriota bacterium]|nr:SIMPL domain-containing protein [Cyanobacteriota bacterium]